MSASLSLTEAQVQFAAEFVTLVVTASALTLVVLLPFRQQRVSAFAGVRAAIAAGCLTVLAAASFAHGSLLVAGQPVEWLGVGRAVAAAGLLVAFPYPIASKTARPIARRGLVVLPLCLGVLAWAAAGLTEALSGSRGVADGLLMGGSLLSIVTLMVAAQRSISVKIGASGAVSLLLVVVVLALALSAVISSSVQHDELNRLAARAGIEKAAMSDPTQVASAARLFEADLAGYFSVDGPGTASNPLVAFASADPVQRSGAENQIAQRLDELANLAHIGDLAYADPTGTVVLPAGTRPARFAGVAGLMPAGCAAGEQGLFLQGGQAALAASSPECTTGNTFIGAAIAITPLDDGFLAQRHQVDPSVSLALVSGRTVLARAGAISDPASVAARYGASGGESIAEAVGGQFVSVANLTLANRGVANPSVGLRLVLATPSTIVMSTRDRLLRTLFLIACGGTILALGLAVLTGDRITAGLRHLTETAARIRQGDTRVRAGVAGDDEVVALGSALDDMVDSLAAQSASLQAAAEDEARLRNRLEAVVAGMTDALVAVDHDGRITDFNQAAEALIGRPAEQVRGAPAEEVVRLVGDDGRPVEPRLFVTGGRPMKLAGSVAGPAGDVPVALSTGPLRGPAGELVGTVVVLRDLRHDQEIERMKTEFLSRVGHELRTPLTGIIGYADMLSRREVPPERSRAWHDEILQSARRLLRIVEMLEFFASAGAGRNVMRPEPVDVAALVGAIASARAPHLPAHLTLGRRIAREPALVAADRRWLSLAVEELLDNAVKFSPDGGRIGVRVARTADHIEVSVSDQGLGMSADQFDAAFGEF
ncbi:MAG: PAS domain-containing protein, partial [Acidimicrobiales bacterium]|nr:PAS domain-containing protein [Acidimicrobiales bacterium]